MASIAEIQQGFRHVAQKASETNRAGSTLQGQSREALAHLNALETSIRDHLGPAINSLNAITANCQGVVGVNAEARTAIQQIGGGNSGGQAVPALLSMCHAIDEGAKQASGATSMSRQRLNELLQALGAKVKEAQQYVKQSDTHAGNVMRVAAGQVQAANDAISRLGGV